LEIEYSLTIPMKPCFISFDAGYRGKRSTLEGWISNVIGGIPGNHQGPGGITQQQAIFHVGSVDYSDCRRGLSFMGIQIPRLIASPECSGRGPKYLGCYR